MTTMNDDYTTFLQKISLSSLKDVIRTKCVKGNYENIKMKRKLVKSGKTSFKYSCHANQAIDLVFIVDSSSSLTYVDFKKTREFLKEVVQGFDISPFQTHVGMVLYSTQVSVEFQLNQYYDKQVVINAIDHMTYRPGSTETAKALQVAVEQVFDTRYGSRPNVVQVLLVITDGYSDDLLARNTTPQWRTVGE
ncbi:hypothetical protein CHS0354_012846 [Potamilus streckersoni]|uniref:VWFA domain-containing protein n=1 Tax=Potamilus streckersoni TaxID=2493646 RepID=A0AAE0W3K8_9BIVA|nr:hypothetical protein CHS0354_012846 [Potamilus streckersoni]